MPRAHVTHKDVRMPRAQGCAGAALRRSDSPGRGEKTRQTCGCALRCGSLGGSGGGAGSSGRRSGSGSGCRGRGSSFMPAQSLRCIQCSVARVRAHRGGHTSRARRMGRKGVRRRRRCSLAGSHGPAQFIEAAGASEPGHRPAHAQGRRGAPARRPQSFEQADCARARRRRRNRQTAREESVQQTQRHEARTPRGSARMLDLLEQS